MIQYVNKDNLVEKIKNRIKETESMQPKFDQFWAGQISAFKGVLKILDTLEVKEADSIWNEESKIIPEDIKSKEVETVYNNCDVCPHKGNLMCCHNCPNF